MKTPVLHSASHVGEGVEIIPSSLPIVGYGILPVNAFLIRAQQPVLVDTGMALLRDPFLASLRSLITLRQIRWIWLTHTDPDHIGNLAPILESAPDARVVTTYLGMGKMALLGLPTERCRLLNPGQVLDVGDRRLECLRPPTYDAPETTALLDSSANILFSADCFGALLPQFFERAVDIDPHLLREGQVAWATVDAPWLPDLVRSSFLGKLERIGALQVQTVLSSHLPPAHRMTEKLLQNLSAALGAPPFVGPDQKQLDAMLSSAQPTSPPGIGS